MGFHSIFLYQFLLFILLKINLNQMYKYFNSFNHYHTNIENLLNFLFTQFSTKRFIILLVYSLYTKYVINTLMVVEIGLF